jgi:cell division protein FtsZ
LLPDEAVLEDDTVTAAPEEAPLPLAIGQAVPTPKPPQAEPEPVVARSRAKVEPQLGNEPFIAPTPSRPEEDRTPLRRPDPLAEADVVNAGSRPPKEKKGGFSLFRRMTGSRSAEAPAPKAAEPAKPRVESPPPERVRQATAPTAPEPTPEAAAPVPAEPAAQPREEEDLLEIPSFLRRQAN